MQQHTLQWRQRFVKSRGAMLGAIGALVVACGGPTVDPALVGAWEIPVPGGHWVLTIDGAGHYEFAVQGGAAPSHSGEFSAHNGAWSMHATSLALDDQGQYSVGADGALQLTGNRGALRWQHGATTAAATPLAGGAAAAAAPPRPMPAPIAAAPAAPTPTPTPVVARAGNGLPDTIDPCRLVTADEAGDLLGTAVKPEQTTPQPKQQNNCLYRVPRTERSLGVVSNNGGGLDVAAYLAGGRTRGGTPVDGIGDGAVFAYNEPLNITSLSFVIGAASFDVRVGGVPRARAEPAVRQLAAAAAKRAISSNGAFQEPGMERLAGTWMSRVVSQNNAAAVFWIERDGRVRVQVSNGFAGQMVLNGSSWRVESAGNPTPPTGQWSLSGDQLKVQGEMLTADLTRVPCKKGASRVKPPFDFTMLIAARLNGKNLSALNPSADGSNFDARLAGLWEGEGTTKGRTTQVLASLDDRGRSVFALFPVASGTITLNNGSYRLDLGPKDVTTGTYHFLGGSQEGLVQLREGDTTYELQRYDPNMHPPYEEPIVGHCR